ncbi:MAG: peptide chain release factor N(5)-glutamine methyltransferase [Pseudomonadota bacterium]
MTTGSNALRAAIPLLRDAGIPDAARDARLLLAHAMGIGSDRLTLHLPDDLAPEAVTRFHAAIAARAARQPLSQITGQRLFWGRSFRVTADVLDPRPETELLVQTALLAPFSTMLDLGTGSGCILLSCLADRPAAQGLGTDLSPAALAVAQSNADALALPQARFARSDWFAAVTGTYDLITSNPPYIAAAEMAALSPEVRRHEPHMALTPGGDGLDAYRAIARGAGAHLVPGGRLLLEIGPTQSAAVCALLAAAGLPRAQTLTDLDGRDRVVAVTKAV